MTLISLDAAVKAAGTRLLLDRVSAGIAARDRIGVVGRNGAGKTTLLAVLAGHADLDGGRAVRSRGLRVGYLPQAAALAGPVRQLVFGDLPEHQWAADALRRELLAVLLSGIDLSADAARLSGGEGRRVALASVLRQPHDVLLLDEPTNHLDIQAIQWLAGYLARRPGALAVVTHDRWFLDQVTGRTWEIADGQVQAYEGGYAAYVLAKAERLRLAAAADQRRRNLLRKELAWLRRGPPARTAKPKFRLDAAAALIADEPAPRDAVELNRLAVSRLGKTVLELKRVTAQAGQRQLLSDVTWQLDPGDRVGVVGVNGSGKTTLLRLLAGDLAPASGTVIRGQTVRIGYLTQEPPLVDPDLRAIDAAEQVRMSVRMGGREITASQLLDRLGLRGDRQRTPVGELSGGERRRLQLQVVLMAEPNVLLLDEPTNDLDIETLTELEDLLDGFAGSVIVVSHDRYFLDRVTDHVLGLLGGQLAYLPGGIPEYLERLDRLAAQPAPDSRSGRQPNGIQDGAAGAGPTGSGRAAPAAGAGAARQRQAKKELARLDRQLGRLADRESDLHDALARAASDYQRLAELGAELDELEREKADLETRWLTAADDLG